MLVLFFFGQRKRDSKKINRWRDRARKKKGATCLSSGVYKERNCPMTILNRFFLFVCIRSGVNRMQSKSKKKNIMLRSLCFLSFFFFLAPASRTGILQGVFLADRSGEKNGPCGRNKQIARRARSKKNNEQKTKLPTRKEL